jgi:hypothetical protein
MSVGVILAGMLLAGAALALGTSSSSGASSGPEARLELEAVARRSILFGHQSVGMNLLDGLERLAAREGLALQIVDVSRAPVAAPGTLAHFFVGQNRSPYSKLDGFARALGAISTGSPDIAIVKFCYVDFEPGTDVAALFARYQATLGDLQALHPRTRFVHVTAPLSEVQAGPKAWVKRLLGRTPYGLAENARREEFNALVRNAYAGREPVFDLALVESTLADGTRSTVEWNGRKVPVLASRFTDDGGHLNEEGRLRAAREFLAVLAATSPR